MRIVIGVEQMDETNCQLLLRLHLLAIAAEAG